MRNFQPISRRISVTVQDRTMVIPPTTEGWPGWVGLGGLLG